MYALWEERRLPDVSQIVVVDDSVLHVVLLRGDDGRHDVCEVLRI